MDWNPAEDGSERLQKAALFKQASRIQQVDWREQAWPEARMGGSSGDASQDHVFADDELYLNFWPGLWPDAPFSLDRYLQQTGIQAHKDRGNLLSSWTLAANLYFPFGQDPAGRQILAGFLAARVDPRIAAVECVELEFADEPPRDQATLLGENGRRGANQTSPDVGIRVVLDDGRVGLLLVENKFTEHDFYACSLRKRLPRSSKLGLCRGLRTLVQHPREVCEAHGTTCDRYWVHLAESFRAGGGPDKVQECPAAKHGYQLLRQQSLAEALAGIGHYGLVASVIAHDGDSPALMACLKDKGLPRIDRDWAGLFQGLAKFTTFTHRDWVTWVRASASRPAWAEDWLRYVGGRYRY